MFSSWNTIKIAATKKYVSFVAFILVLLSALGPGGAEEAVLEESRSTTGASTGGRSLLAGWTEEAHRHLVALVGTQPVETAVECVQVAVRFLSEGTASGLNVIGAYVTEILKAAGMDVVLPFPHFTPEGVAAVTQWALLALIGYWVLSLVLRLVASVLRRVMRLLKLVVALVLFGMIVSDNTASTDLTALRLAILVLVYALLGLGWTRAKPEEGGRLGARMRELEGRLKEVERRKMEEQ
ncbi:hypothetical protein AGOR_G00182780 [Albula goreensis]|uniref:Transmembrane protein 109 n=1 Tax=Albula goreensis TaxID=1534307 RepID=A0A8T3CVY9_9TELE|nr:hypothetical protein AGOR_G00182780 [Albula goreensis]